MSAHPVHFQVRPSVEPMDRLQVLVRVLLLAAVGALGYSSILGASYLALPALAALRIADGGGERYVAEDGPRIVRALRWLAGVEAYLWLLTDRWPASAADPPPAPVEFQVGLVTSPTTGSALLRLILGLPALLVIGLLSLAAAPLWILGALAILVFRQVPLFVTEFLVMTVRFRLRWIAYHLSLVERYPSIHEATGSPGTQETTLARPG